MNSITKVCRKCFIEKSVSEFIKDKTKKDGLYSSCRSCNKKDYEAGKSKWSASKAVYKEKNREAILQKKRKRYYDNRKENLLKMKEWHIKNKDKEKEYREKNKEKLAEASNRWRLANKDKVNAAMRRRRKENPEKTRMHKANRIYRERGAGGKITDKEWIELCNKYGNKCVCCGDSKQKLTVDHVLPISKGGLNLIENIQPLCRSCNSRKNNRHIDYREDTVVV